MRGKWSGNAGNGSKWIHRPRRLAIYERDGYRCVWCGIQVEAKISACLDHLVPRSQGGTHKSNNLVTSCFDCNSDRGDCPWEIFARDDQVLEYIRKVIECH